MQRMVGLTAPVSYEIEQQRL